jgi:hypothetical protein
LREARERCRQLRSADAPHCASRYAVTHSEAIDGCDLMVDQG